MEPIVIIEEVERMVADMAHERGFAEGEELGRRQGEELGRRQGEELGRRQGEELGRRQGEELGRLEGAREGLTDLAQAYGLPLDEARRSWIASATLEQLDGVRVILKRDRAWPR